MMMKNGFTSEKSIYVSVTDREEQSYISEEQIYIH